MELEFDTQKSMNKLSDLDEKLDILNKKIKEVESVNIPENLGNNIDYQKLINQKNQLNRKAEEYLSQLDNEKIKLSEINSKLKANKTTQENTNKKISNLNKNLSGINLNNIKNGLNNINDGLQNTIKKVGKWALGIFAISSAYSLVRNAMSTLTQYDDQMQSNLQYIQYALASTLKPLIETILNLVVKLLQYVNYISQAWFGVNLFGSAEDFKSMADSSKQTAKNVKETKKSLVSGIDEITNLDSDKNDSGNSGGADSGIKMPSFNLNSMDAPVPSWLQWIVDNKELILSVMAGVAAGLLAWKLGLDPLMSLGLGVTIAGIVYTIQSVIDYLNDPSWQNFGKIITGIGVIIAGIALMFGAWPVAVAGAVVAVLGIIISNWEKIKEFFLNIAKWFEDNLGEFGVFIGSQIRDFISMFDGLFTGIKQIFDGIIKIAKGDFAGGLKQIIKGLANVLISIVNSITSGINLIILPIRGLIVAAGKVLGKKWNMSNIKIPMIPKLARGGIVNNPGKGINMGSYIAGEKGAEAILPLQNSSFINGFASQIADKIGNSDINTQLLMDLNKNILELANKPIYFRVNGKDLAQATYDDFQNEEKRQQKSAVVVRS